MTESPTVLMLMSGGVDSSTAAALLLEQGYRVIGVTMKQLDVEPRQGQGSGCCSYGDVRDAKSVAAALEIPHYTINTAPEFAQRVIQPFLRSYESGLTPNPCVHCNSYVRYEEAMALAEQWECRFVATGHYARVARDENGEPHLFRAVCREKDQSYFLYGVRKELLQSILFPLGDQTKEEVRQAARQLGLSTAEKPESQEICFTLGRSCQDFLAEHLENREGPILDRAGNVLGTHKGIAFYTVGQRRGLGLAGGPYYVCALDSGHNAVIVGRKSDLGVQTVCAAGARWLHLPNAGERVWGQIRSRHQPAPAVVEEIQASTCRIRFDTAQYGVAPGQALVPSSPRLHPESNPTCLHNRLKIL